MLEEAGAQMTTVSQAPMDLLASHVVLGEQGTPYIVEDAPAFWQDIMTGAFKTEGVQRAGTAGYLVAQYTHTQDSPIWELHPHGTDLLYLLSGHLVIELETPGGNQTVDLSAGRSFLIPQATWHRLHAPEPSSLLAITWGAGTQFRPA